MKQRLPFHITVAGDTRIWRVCALIFGHEIVYDVFLEIEVCGGLQIMEKYPDVLSIFVLPPSMDTLEKRLRDRNTEDEETIIERLGQAKREMPDLHFAIKLK